MSFKDESFPARLPNGPTDSIPSEPTNQIAPAQHSLESKFDVEALDASENLQSFGRLGNYDLLNVLGSGGMGVVFHGYDLRLRRFVAVKLLNRQLATSPTAKRRFMREGRAAAAINHDNVVTIYSVEQHRHSPFLVMEFIDGESLRSLIRREGSLDAIDALKIVAQVADGLAAAHVQGVIHRDIKPSNILLDKSGRAKLSDFGLARAAIDNVDLTGAGAVVGTPAYMAPEQVLGKPIDPRADLFALGCLIYAMLSGASPFQGKSYYEISRGVTDHSPIPLHQLDSRIPRFLSDLTDKLLEKDPDCRPQAAAEVSQALNRRLVVLNQASSDRIEQLLHEQRADDWSSPKPKFRRLTTSAAVLLFILTVAAGVFWWRTLQTELTVSLDGSGEFATLPQAIAAAQPGDVIHLTTAGNYLGPIVLDGPQRRDISILGAPGVRIAAPADQHDVVLIKDSPGVTLRGLQLDVKDVQIGIALAGRCDGVVVADCEIHQSPQAKLAAVYLQGGAAGAEEAPLRLSNLKIRCGAVGVVIGQDDSPADALPVQHVELVDSRITGPSTDAGVLLILMAKLKNIKVSNNILSTGVTAISLDLPQPRSTQKVAIEHNTIFSARHLFYAERVARDQSVMIRNNLVADVRRLMYNERNRANLPDGVRDNTWEKGAMDEYAELAPVAAVVERIPFLSRDPDDADYLKLAPASHEAAEEN